MKKIKSLLPLCMLLLLVGCGQEKSTPDGTVVYYLNKDTTAIVPVEFEMTGDGPETKVEEFLAKLEETPADVSLRRTIPENVKLISYVLDRKQLYLDFSAEYLGMDKPTEVLVRSALVKTMVQVDEISFVAIRVAGEPLKDSKGTNIGLMNENTFLDNMGSEENATKIVKLNLYFANKTGDKLKSQSTVIEYNANVAVEKVVVEQLIAGTTEDGYYATLPKDTKVISVTTKDNVCYVNLDSGFTGQGYDVLGTVTIYSIVNSLTELPGITSVQLLINGETSITYKGNISLETTFQKNTEIMEKEK